MPYAVNDLLDMSAAELDPRSRQRAQCPGRGARRDSLAGKDVPRGDEDSSEPRDRIRRQSHRRRRLRRRQPARREAVHRHRLLEALRRRRAGPRRDPDDRPRHVPRPHLLERRIPRLLRAPAPEHGRAALAPALPGTAGAGVRHPAPHRHSSADALSAVPAGQLHEHRRSIQIRLDRRRAQRGISVLDLAGPSRRLPGQASAERPSRLRGLRLRLRE